MIRLALSLLLTALPATAQDFRGLLPGMPASDLGPIGEPETVLREDGLTLATFPLPFEQRLQVLYEDSGTILWVNSYALPFAPEPPDRGGLMANEMSVADVARHLGGAAAALETPGLILAAPDDSGMRLIYDHASNRDLIVSLVFSRVPIVEPDNTPDPILPLDANWQFVGAELFDRHTFALGVPQDAFVDGPRAAPIPFPLPIDEAFPSLIP